jgi:hypothetical protein
MKRLVRCARGGANTMRASPALTGEHYEIVREGL